MHLAAERNLIDEVTLFLNNGANPNIRNTLGYTPLHIAAREGHDRIAKLLAAK